MCAMQPREANDPCDDDGDDGGKMMKVEEEQQRVIGRLTDLRQRGRPLPPPQGPGWEREKALGTWGAVMKEGK